MKVNVRHKSYICFQIVYTLSFWKEKTKRNYKMALMFVILLLHCLISNYINCFACLEFYWKTRAELFQEEVKVGMPVVKCCGQGHENFAHKIVCLHFRFLILLKYLEVVYDVIVIVIRLTTTTIKISRFFPLFVLDEFLVLLNNLFKEFIQVWWSQYLTFLTLLSSAS